MDQKKNLKTEDLNSFKDIVFLWYGDVQVTVLWKDRKVFNNAFLAEEQGCDNFVVVYLPVKSFVIQDQNSSIET